MPNEISTYADHLKPSSFPYNLIFPNVACAVYPNIYVPLWFFTDLLRGKVTPYMEAVLAHEQTHLDRQVATGVNLWYRRYIFEPTFRLDEELVAIQAQLAILVARNAEYDYKKAAASLSSLMYGRMISNERATRILSSLWDDANRPRA